MNGIAVAPEWEAVLAALAVVALLLFVAGTWTGRWSLWVGGYGVAIIALAGVFLLRGVP